MADWSVGVVGGGGGDVVNRSMPASSVVLVVVVVGGRIGGVGRRWWSTGSGGGMVKTGAMGVKWTDGVEGKIITYMLRYDTIISSDGAWPGAANGALAANPRCE